MCAENKAQQIEIKLLREKIDLLIRRKYVKRVEPHQAPIIAALSTLQERSIAAPGMLAQIIVAK